MNKKSMAFFLVVLFIFIYFFSPYGHYEINKGLEKMYLFTKRIVGGEVSKEDLIKNPENYWNKTVTVTASPTTSLSMKFHDIYKHKITTENKEGATIGLGASHDGDFHCQKCELTGTVKNFSICTCQKDRCSDSKTYCSEDNMAYEHNWETISFHPNKPVSKCEKGPREIEFGVNYEITWYRCKPNSTRQKYYFDVQEVKEVG